VNRRQWSTTTYRFHFCDIVDRFSNREPLSNIPESFVQLFVLIEMGYYNRMKTPRHVRGGGHFRYSFETFGRPNIKICRVPNGGCKPFYGLRRQLFCSFFPGDATRTVHQYNPFTVARGTARHKKREIFVSGGACVNDALHSAFLPRSIFVHLYHHRRSDCASPFDSVRSNRSRK